jgi:hypothetical protein
VVADLALGNTPSLPNGRRDGRDHSIRGDGHRAACDRKRGVVGQRPLDHGERDRAQFGVLNRGAQKSDRALAQQHSRAWCGQNVVVTGKVEQYEPARRLAQIVNASHRFLAAVAGPPHR